MRHLAFFSKETSNFVKSNVNFSQEFKPTQITFIENKDSMGLKYPCKFEEMRPNLWWIHKIKNFLSLLANKSFRFCCFYSFFCKVIFPRANLVLFILCFWLGLQKLNTFTVSRVSNYAGYLTFIIETDLCIAIKLWNKVKCMNLSVHSRPYLWILLKRCYFTDNWEKNSKFLSNLINKVSNILATLQFLTSCSFFIVYQKVMFIVSLKQFFKTSQILI